MCSPINIPLQARDQLVDSICRKEVGVYTQIFSATGETAAIDRTERRYAWLRKRLRAREDVWAVFPEAWRVQQHVCLLFCKVGRLQDFWGVVVWKLCRLGAEKAQRK